MALTLEQFGIEKLSVPQRLELMDVIWKSIASNLGQYETPDWHKRILDDRIANYEANPDGGITWEEAKARLGSPR